MVLCLCAWWIEGRWQWRNLARVAPIFLMSVVAGALSIWTQGLHLAEATDPQWVQSWPERLVAAGDAVWFYLGKLLWPHPLTFIYPRWEIDAGQWISYLPLLAVIVVLFIFWLKRETWSHPWFFVFAYFLAALLPALGLLDNAIFQYSLVFDHFQYLAAMGPLVLASAGLVKFAKIAIPQRPWLQSILCAGLLLVLGLLSWQWTWAYESADTLWTDTLAKNPNCWAAHFNLGYDLFQKEQMDESIIHYQKALEIYPNYVEAHCNLGFALFKKGQVDEAIAQYQMALEINPNNANAHNNLGLVLVQKGHVDEAIAQYQKVLEINPNNADAHNNLGLVFVQKGQVDEAIAQYQKALEINPNDADAHSNLGLILVQKGQVDEAIAQYQKAFEINPDFAEAYYNFGNALVQKGQVDEAMIQYQQALKINPHYAEAHNNLGTAFFEKGQIDDSIIQYQKALEISPTYVEAQNNLAKAQAMVRQKASQR
jgi:tetratricopeptide (TPR) repeat protein